MHKLIRRVFIRLNLHAKIEIALATVLLIGSGGQGLEFESKFGDAEPDAIGDIEAP